MRKDYFYLSVAFKLLCFIGCVFFFLYVLMGPAPMPIKIFCTVLNACSVFLSAFLLVSCVLDSKK